MLTRDSVVIISIVFAFTFILCFVTAFFRVYVVLHTYLDDRGIVISKILEKEIIKELNIKYSYKKYLTIKIDINREVENKILADIEKDYGKVISDNVID